LFSAETNGFTPPVFSAASEAIRTSISPSILFRIGSQSSLRLHSHRSRAEVESSEMAAVALPACWPSAPASLACQFHVSSPGRTCASSLCSARPSFTGQLAEQVVGHFTASCR
jgi:hypothetical protein